MIQTGKYQSREILLRSNSTSMAFVSFFLNASKNGEEDKQPPNARGRRLSRMACAFAMRSALTAQLYSEVARTNGESAKREFATTFSTISPGTSLMSFVKGSSSALGSYRLSLALLVKVQTLLGARLNFLPSNYL